MQCSNATTYKKIVLGSLKDKFIIKFLMVNLKYSVMNKFCSIGATLQENRTKSKSKSISQTRPVPHSLHAIKMEVAVSCKYWQ